MKRIFVFLAGVVLLSSCVSSKQFKDVSGRLGECEDNYRQLSSANQELQVQKNELNAAHRKLQGDYETLRSNLQATSGVLQSTEQLNQRLKRQNDELEEQLQAIKRGSTEEISRLLNELQLSQSDLQNREDKLKTAEAELQARNMKLIELQDALQQKELAVKELKQKVMNALVGFSNDGLTVHEKNGKVYVSLEERLLFQTGQWNVDQRGQRALTNLAEVLAQNPDINILVEGHTDNVPMRGTGAVKDNWDLSVMRATAVTKILLQNPRLSPERVTAAGRGEFSPIAEGNTSEARQKNRRTEIILTPRLDELFKMLETN